MCLMNPYFFSTLVQHPSFPISLFWIFHLWRIILNFHLKLCCFPILRSLSSCSQHLSHCCEIEFPCNQTATVAAATTAAAATLRRREERKSLNKARWKAQGGKTQKTTQTHSKKQQKTKTGPKQPEGKLIYIYSLCFSWSQTQSLNYEACRSVHFSYCWI